MQSCFSAIPRDFESEEVFYGLFDRELHEEDKASVYIILTRLRRVLNWDPGDDDFIFDKQNGQQITQEAISVYRSWKQFFDTSGADTLRLKHLILCSLAKLCFSYWIKDTEVVSEILQEMYSCDGHFSSIFAHIINSNDGNSLWRQSPLLYSKQREDLATVYFVNHAYKAKLQFFGCRFVDVPLRHPLAINPAFLAAIYRRPQLLLHLLRYGAIIEVSENATIESWTLPMLLKHLVRILWNTLGDDLQLVSTGNSVVMSNSMHDVADCLRILLRVIPQIRMNELNFMLMKFDQLGVLSGISCSHGFIHILNDTGLVPTFVNRYLEPSSLSHLCRCAVRKCLNDAWNLPFGIHELPLPRILKRYVALIDD